ncbi:MAG: biopolymer transporter Tol [bacterium]
MMLAKKILLLGGLLAFSSFCFGQDSKPVVVIDQSARFSIYVEPISGPNSAEMTRILEDDLKMSGSFNLVAQSSATLIAEGVYAGQVLTGKLTPYGQSPSFNRVFEGDWRQAVHLFADAIVKSVTGVPGIASTRVAFISSSTGSKEVYVMDIDGSNVVQLTNDKSISLGPKWSPNGKEIAYTSYCKNFPDVWIINLATSRRKRVAFFPGLNAQPAFSPDGETIALTLSKDGNTELYMLPVSGGSPTRLTQTRGTEASPTWSPAGDQIAFVSDDRGSIQLFAISSKGRPMKKIDTNSFYTTEPDWSPDGKMMAYSTRIGGQFQIAVTSLETGKQMILTSYGNNETPSWTRDSRHLVYARDGNLYLLDSLTKQSLQIKNNLTRNSEPNCSR